jgi:anti-sigma regulatory factor (Ser/Thr protein kinase)/serine/threonine protein phosphatase PrpC
MEVIPAVVVAVHDATQISEARRAAQQLADRLEFSETRRGEVGIVVTELARNALVHGKQGHVLLLPVRDEASPWLDVVAIDRGPGIHDLSQALEDGFSTSTTPGTGLGAVRRMASEFQVFSMPAKMTAVMARLCLRRDGGSPRDFSGVGAVCVPIKGEKLCGDGWGFRRRGHTDSFMVVDGLGHGPSAAEAAHEALRIFEAHPEMGPAELLDEMHHGMQKTRGAAVAIAEADISRGVLHFSGVGNIASYILSRGQKMRAMVSHNGTVGHVVSRIQEFTFPWKPNDLLVMHSDGISSHWDVDKFPGLLSREPALIASIIHDQAVRGRDDATVLTARLRSAA